MSESPTFSQQLRERTWSSHGESEGAGFMSDLMKGEGTREDYVALVVQHYYVYEAIEGAAKRLADDPEFARVNFPELTRMPSIIADLEYLIGADWADQISPVPATERYVARINEIADEGWGAGLIAHHYTRYLGDLSGGQVIGKMMKRHFDLEGGISFYVFDQIEDIPGFKDGYRAQIDGMPWSQDDFERYLEETLLAYRFNTELFQDLSAAKQAANA